MVFFSKSQYSTEKLSSYECGFNPFDDARQKFDIKFYLVGILFLIFDLEIIFIVPIAVIFFQLNSAFIIIISIFLLLVFLGLVYEWQKGVLDWN